MKKLTFLIVALFISTSAFSQENRTSYPFKIEIKGEGQPVILIPGLACSGEVWNKTVENLEKNYQCHILTLAGFANQPAIEFGDAYLPLIQENISNYIKNELKEKPILIGHSLGGFMSLSIASTHPDLVEKIVIVDSYPFYSAAMIPTATEETSKPQADMMKNMIVNTPDEAFASQQKMMMKSMVTSNENIDLVTLWSIQTDRKTMAQAMYEIMTTDLRDEAELVKCPILVFGSWYAAKDYGITKEMVTQNYQTQFSKAQNCNIQVADTAKHFVMLDEPEWFLEELNKFFK